MLEDTISLGMAHISLMGNGCTFELSNSVRIVFTIFTLSNWTP